ncbi:hypothetical protein ACI2KT_25320 [Ensifer adhaerens]|nr:MULTISPECIES: hypothetical protein [unclassified Ensifer]MBD9498602.1 hypothetical protein [Ensifer sp. ENS01]MBD9573041.1 hypothetical protein [Ensifer sp. ENS08]
MRKIWASRSLRGGRGFLSRVGFLHLRVANDVGFVVPPSFERAFRPLLLGSPLAACIRPIDGFSIVDFKEVSSELRNCSISSPRIRPHLQGISFSFRPTRGDRHPVRGEMDKREFQQSKVAMLDFFDDLIGVERGNAHRNAGSAE